MAKLLFHHFRAPNSRLENKKFHFELLTRSWKIESSISSYQHDRLVVEIFISKLLTRSWKIKNFYFELLEFEKWKNNILILKSLKIFLLKYILCNLELFDKNVGMLDFVILDIDLALNRYCLRSWSWSHALRYAIVF